MIEDIERTVKTVSDVVVHEAGVLGIVSLAANNYKVQVTAAGG